VFGFTIGFNKQQKRKNWGNTHAEWETRIPNVRLSACFQKISENNCDFGRNRQNVHRWPTIVDSLY